MFYETFDEYKKAIFIIVILIKCSQIKGCLDSYHNYAQSIYHVSASQDCQATPIVMYYNPYYSQYGQDVYDQLQQYYCYEAYKPYYQSCDSKCGNYEYTDCNSSPIIIIHEDCCKCCDGISFDNLLALIETVMASDTDSRPCSCQNKKGSKCGKCKCSKNTSKSGTCDSCKCQCRNSNARDFSDCIDKFKNNGDTHITIVIPGYED